MSSIPLPLEAEVHVVEKDGSRRRLQASWIYKGSKVEGADGPTKEPGPNPVNWEDLVQRYTQQASKATEDAFVRGVDQGSKDGSFTTWWQRNRRQRMMQEQFNETWRQILEAERKKRQ